jgi:hypothetical protein
MSTAHEYVKSTSYKLEAIIYNDPIVAGALIRLAENELLDPTSLKKCYHDFTRKIRKALLDEFGFAPFRLKNIVLLEATRDKYTARFRLGQHYYLYDFGIISRIDENNNPLFSNDARKLAEIWRSGNVN